MAEQSDFEAIFVSFQYSEKTGEQKNGARDLVDHILDDVQLKKSGKRRACVTDYIASLLLANRGSNTFNKVIFPQTSEYYGPKGLFAAHYSNFSGYIVKINSDINKALIKYGYITLNQGANSNKAPNIVSATPKLMDLVEQYSVSIISFDKSANKDGLIKIRHAQDDLDKELIEEHRNQVALFNELLIDNDISVAGQLLPKSHKQYYRSFTNALYKQGRFYNSFCHLSNDENQPVLINNKPTTVVKIPASFLLLAYAHQGYDLTESSQNHFEITFEGELIDEVICEKLLQASIDYNSAHLAANSVIHRYKMNKTFIKLTEAEAVSKAIKILNKVKDKHSDVDFKALSPHALVFQESCIAEKLITFAIKENMPMLMRHDYFVIPEKMSSKFIEALVIAIGTVTKFKFSTPERLVSFG